MMEISTVQSLIETGLPDASIEVTGDGRHFEALVVSEQFAGKTLIQRHRMVLDTVNTAITTGELHALSVKAKTPAEISA